MKHKALGKGLGALIPDKPLNASDQILLLPADKIYPSENQPRKTFHQESLNYLAESIRTKGFVIPLIVRPTGNRYELIAGERRWRAARIAGISRIPAIVKRVSNSTALIISVIENLQREDLNPIEAAEAYKRLMDEFGMTQEALGQSIGKDRSTITNALRLLKLPVEVIEKVRSGELSAGHAKALLGLKSDKQIIAFARSTISNNWSVRTLEEKIRAVTMRPPKKELPEPDPILDHTLDLLRRRFATKILLKRKKNGKGSITLEYYSEEDLIRILELLGATHSG